MSVVVPKPKKSRLWIHYTIAGLILIGYLSAWISRPACELKTARLLMTTVRPGTQFYVKPQDASGGKLETWNKSGANYRVYDAAKDGPSSYPWCSIGETRTWLPFVVTVQYGWMREGEWGGEGYLSYLSFFGLTIRVRDTVTVDY